MNNDLDEESDVAGLGKSALCEEKLTDCASSR
jgi:hypothetical protein